MKQFRSFTISAPVLWTAFAEVQADPGELFTQEICPAAGNSDCPFFSPAIDGCRYSGPVRHICKPWMNYFASGIEVLDKHSKILNWSIGIVVVICYRNGCLPGALRPCRGSWTPETRSWLLARAGDIPGGLWAGWRAHPLCLIPLVGMMICCWSGCSRPGVPPTGIRACGRPDGDKPVIPSSSAGILSFRRRRRSTAAGEILSPVASERFRKFHSSIYLPFMDPALCLLLSSSFFWLAVNPADVLTLRKSSRHLWRINLLVKHFLFLRIGHLRILGMICLFGVLVGKIKWRWDSLRNTNFENLFHQIYSLFQQTDYTPPPGKFFPVSTLKLNIFLIQLLDYF